MQLLKSIKLQLQYVKILIVLSAEKADLFLSRKRIPHDRSRRRFKFRVLLENLLYLSIQVMLGFEAMN